MRAAAEFPGRPSPLMLAVDRAFPAVVTFLVVELADWRGGGIHQAYKYPTCIHYAIMCVFRKPRGGDNNEAFTRVELLYFASCFAAQRTQVHAPRARSYVLACPAMRYA